jgi:hypothetical protein
LVIQQSSSSNFTTLPAGTYDIYGVHYFSGSGTNPPPVNPTTWINQNFNIVRNASSCHTISSNSRRINIQDCIVNVTTQTGTSSGSLPFVLSTISSGCRVNFSPGIDTITLTSPMDISGTLTIDGTGQNVLINMNNTSAAYVLKSTIGSNVTIKNVNIRHLNPSTSANILINEGTTNLEGVEVKGNVNQVILNSTSTGKLNVKGVVNVRKT